MIDDLHKASVELDKWVKKSDYRSVSIRIANKSGKNIYLMSLIERINDVKTVHRNNKFNRNTLCRAIENVL